MGKPSVVQNHKIFKFVDKWEKNKINFVDPSNKKPLWPIEVCKKKQLLLIEAKKPIAQVLFLGRLSPYGKYIFGGNLTLQLNDI